MGDSKLAKFPEGTQYKSRYYKKMVVIWKASTEQKRKNIGKESNSNILICSNPFSAPQPPLFYEVFSITNTTPGDENIKI